MLMSFSSLGRLTENGDARSHRELLSRHYEYPRHGGAVDDVLEVSEDAHADDCLQEIGLTIGHANECQSNDESNLSRRSPRETFRAKAQVEV